MKEHNADELPWGAPKLHILFKAEGASLKIRSEVFKHMETQKNEIIG